MTSGPREDDRLFDFNGAQLLVDNISYEFVRGATVDFADELIKSTFEARSCFFPLHAWLQALQPVPAWACSLCGLQLMEHGALKQLCGLAAHRWLPTPTPVASAAAVPPSLRKMHDDSIAWL
jgi:hypothetical protein